MYVQLYEMYEHQHNSLKGKWNSSGKTEYTLTSHRRFNWIQPKTMARESDYGKIKIREEREIKKVKYNKTINFLNRDESNLVKTNTWTPLFVNINNVLSDLVQLRIIVIKNISERVLYLA